MSSNLDKMMAYRTMRAVEKQNQPERPETGWRAAFLRWADRMLGVR